MKRIIAMLLCLTMLTGLFTVLCGTLVFAEGDMEAELMDPTEITLTSTKNYSNPYQETTIDAVFTHDDGTKVSVPGFWKEDDTWAVRFTPTKTGNWSYTITCADTENTGLQANGKITVKDNDKSNAFEEHGFVVVEDNARNYSYADGTPFFWLGDTNWQAPNYIQTDACNYPGCKCDNQFKHEVDNRKAKGFNVYQTYFDSGESDGGGQRGKLPSIWTTRHKEPNTDVFNKKIDYMFEYLYEQGMVVALGMGVHTNTMSSMSEADYLRFVRYVVARYGCYSIVWITGQEITDEKAASATPGKTTMEIYMNGAALTDALDGYDHPNSAHMYPMNSTDSRAMKLDQAEWHDSWTLQGGHGGTVKAKSFYRSYYYNPRTTIKPLIESENNYEDINCGGFTGYNANRYNAWNSVLCGSAGFTYGVTGIWANCYSNETNTGWFGPGSFSYEPWFMGLDKPGSYEVAYLKYFFETIPDWTKLIPRYENILYGNFVSDKEKVLASTEDGSTCVAYFYNSDTTTGILFNLQNGTYKTMWFNPLTGKFTDIGSVEVTDGKYTIPEKPDKSDWTFVITRDEMGSYATQSLPTVVESDENNTITGNIITPKSVKAVGGCYYEKGKLIDQTKVLYDLSGKIAWEPLSDRVSQTIIYDLGAAYNLTHMTVAPGTGTILPDYRIEVSNNGVDWTIMANSAIRDARMSADGTYISETLTGAYRYVKLLLLNAESSSAASKEYKVTYNENQKLYYSHTAIAEISVFGTGLADADDIVDDNNTNTNNGNNNAVVDDNNTNVGGDDVNNTETGISTGVAIGIICGAAVVGIIIGVVVAIVIKKKKA